MSQTVRLEVHRITLERKNQIKGSRSRYSKCNYENLLKIFNEDKAMALREFWAKFIDYFGNCFLTNTDGDKAITTKKELQHTIASKHNVINGEICGGPTNRKQRIFNINDSNKELATISDEDVVSSNFYIKLWLPYDYDTGVLMIQSYSNANVSDLVKDHLRKFVQKYGFKLTISAFLPEEIEKNRKKASNVVSVTYVKDNISKDKSKLINPLFSEFDNLKIKVVVSGFKTPAKSFFEKFANGGHELATDIDVLDLKKDETQNVITTYQDENGRKSTYRIDNNRLRNLAYIFLPEEIKADDKNSYDFKKITEHTDSILQQIKREINYIPKLNK